MKVLIVAGFIPPRIGGIERHTHGLASYLSGEPDTQVVVSCSSLKGTLKEKSPYRVIAFPSKTIGGRLPIPNLLSIKPFWALIKAIKSTDVVILQSHLFPLTWLVAILARKVSRRIWVTHSSGFIPEKNFLLSRLLKFWEILGLRHLNKFANTRISTSMGGIKWLESRGIKNPVLIPNSIETETIIARQNQILSDPKIHFLFVGRLLKGKGGLEAIKILQIFQQLTTRDFDLTVIGDGFELGAMRSLSLSCKFDVIFIGEASHSEVLSIMRKTDILLFTSTIPESMPTVILEAAASGMLVITTPVSGLESLINQKLVIPSTSINFAGEIQKAIISITESRNMSLKASAYVIRNFSWGANYSFLNNEAWAQTGSNRRPTD